MPRRLAGVAIAMIAALALAGVAAAHNGTFKRAHVYRAWLAKTPAADTAQLPDVRAHAQLVDGKKRNKISIHVRGLKPGDTYLWHIHKAKNATDDPCAADSLAADSAPYGDWVYRTLTANKAGNASAKGTSATFDSRSDAGPYYVDVQLTGGTAIACGALKMKLTHAHGKHAGATKPSPRHEQAEAHAYATKPGGGHGA
jgi:hypothetical protein